MRIADVQPLVDCSWRSGEPIPPMDGWYVGCAVRPAGGAGFEGPWRAYRYVGAPLTGDNKPKGLTTDVLDASADYVFCGVFGLLSEAFGAIDEASRSGSGVERPAAGDEPSAATDGLDGDEDSCGVVSVDRESVGESRRVARPKGRDMSGSVPGLGKRRDRRLPVGAGLGGGGPF
ncbi:hypothetical protein [Bifidobacterium sp. SO1]|uniref:hypothetical protein n=1 Tax=Bifidobacterium sp. SO1 TaxID=2809029 RepID=UPI001BDCC36B|nr:hypothetical protein [Bifidobacterium sp. SO1]MBT1160950.1 hypothetical protein [Bifidobacterium sp. SO1]